MSLNKVELLAPAGDLEKLKIAVEYGADAVYIAGQTLGLRAKAKNFDINQMEEGIRYGHDKGVRVYIAANVFAHNADFDGIEDYFKSLAKIGADAFIISDPGVFNVAKQTCPDMEIHISTQANNTNYQSAMFWGSLGAKRIVLARELSFKEIAEIKSKVGSDIELEAFVHGAMCISYSGRCLLSNYLADRDANKGECSHPCRWRYSLVEEKRPGEYMPIMEDERGTYIFNSKDLCMIHHIPQIVSSGIDSLKIEGRMKTPYYVATVVTAYRQAIDDFYKSPELYESNKKKYMEEITKSSHRHFTTGFYFNKPDTDSQIYDSNTYVRNYDFIGMVMDFDKETGIALIEQRNKFVVGDSVEFLRAGEECFTQTITEIIDAKTGETIDSAPHPQQMVKIKAEKPLKKLDMMRKIVVE